MGQTHLVSSNPGAFRQVEVIPLHGTRIAVVARGQEELNRLTGFSYLEMQLESIKKRLLFKMILF